MTFKRYEIQRLERVVKAIRLPRASSYKVEVK